MSDDTWGSKWTTFVAFCVHQGMDINKAISIAIEKQKEMNTKKDALELAAKITSGFSDNTQPFPSQDDLLSAYHRYFTQT